MTEKNIFISCAAVLTAFLLHRLIFSRRKINLIWPLLLFVCILGMIYRLNINNRIHSYHGFMHAGVVYEILNKEIPPSNPLMANNALPYPWGYEFVAAKITWLLNISPFYSFAIINIISLAACICLLYMISRLLLKDQNSNILSAIVSIFAITVFTPSWLKKCLKDIDIFTESRGFPVFEKFSNVNGVPLGLVFYLLFLYSLINIFNNRKIKSSSALFFISILAGGFIYPQFVPGIIATVIVVCGISFVMNRKTEPSVYLKKNVLVVVLLAIGIIILYPYISSVSSGTKGQIELFNVDALLANLTNFIVLCFPISVIIFLSRRILKINTDRQALVIIFAAAAAMFCCYIFIHMPWTNEYKFLTLSMVTLGIPAGLSLTVVKQRWNGTIVFILLLFFIYPAFNNIDAKLKHLSYLPILYSEKGRYIHPNNLEENELYEWIREKTSSDDVFVDTELMLPVFAQRKLFIAIDKHVSGHPAGYPGYSFVLTTFFRLICAYEMDLIINRTRTVTTIYNSSKPLSPQQKSELCGSGNNIYVIVRKAIVRKTFDRNEFTGVFRSTNGSFLVYRYEGNSPE